jgi:hypothetical protein
VPSFLLISSTIVRTRAIGAITGDSGTGTTLGVILPPTISGEKVCGFTFGGLRVSSLTQVRQIIKRCPSESSTNPIS